MTRVQPIVLSLGGSIFVTGENDKAFLEKLLEVVRKVARSGPLAIVVGGGRTARQYISVAREMGLGEVELDELGIEVTRLHAKMLSHLLAPDAPLKPPVSIPEAAGEIGRWPIVVMGGTEPGHTTDGVAALLAERIHARLLVNATRVGGLYDKDPRKHDDAKLIPRMDFDTFLGWVSSQTEGRAGQEFVFDRLGAESLARSRIPLAVVNGRILKDLEAALSGKKFNGSLISDR
jgi:uridylate kinase